MKEQVYNSQNGVHRAVKYSCVISNGVEKFIAYNFKQVCP